MTDSPNPHPIGSLAYWQHCLTSLNQRMAEAVNMGMRIKARGLRDDANEVRTIIDRIKAIEAKEEDLAIYQTFGEPHPTLGIQAIQVPGREPINHLYPCIDCGKPHHGLQGRCRDCKNLYKSRSNSPKQERERLRFQERKLKKKKMKIRPSPEAMGIAYDAGFRHSPLCDEHSNTVRRQCICDVDARQKLLALAIDLLVQDKVETAANYYGRRE